MKTIRIEKLNINNINIILSLLEDKIHNSNQIGSLEALLIALQNSINMIFKRMPLTYFAIEDSRLIGLIRTESFNNNLSTRIINEPIIFTESSSISLSLIKKELIKAPLSDKNINPISWLITSDTLNTDLISSARQLGFQPLKQYYRWSLTNEFYKNLKNKPKSSSYRELKWQHYDKSNIHELIRLDNQAMSTLLRQIKDLRYQDFLNNNTRNSGLIVSIIDSRVIGIAATLPFNLVNSSSSLILIRDTLYDSRIPLAVEMILEQISSVSNHTYIDTCTEDKVLYSIMKNYDLYPQSEIILLGKSSWKKNEPIINKLPLVEIENIFNNLNREIPPLANPIIF